MIRRFQTNILMFLLTISGALQAAAPTPPRVSDVVFEGNVKTKTAILLQELSFKIGDPLDELTVARSRQALMDLELFKDVSVAVETTNDQAVVTYSVKEKHYFYALPRFSRTSDGELSLGAQLQFDNLRGLNQQLKIKVERSEEDDGNGDASNQLKIDYDIPRFVGSRFGLNLELEKENAEDDAFSGEEEVGEVESDSEGYGLSLSWLIEENELGEKWTAMLGWNSLNRDYTLVSGSIGDLQAGLDNQIHASVGYYGVHQDKYRRWGNAYGIEYKLGDEVVGSDFDYHNVLVYYRRYLPVGSDRLDNLNFQLRAGYASDAPFGGFAYELGGSKTLRGIEHDKTRGYNMVLLNTEYLLRFHRHPRLRVVMFSDLGNAFERNKFDFTDLEWTIGAGIRWKIPSFVRVDLRVDAGYDTDTGDNKIYIGTDHVF